MSLAVGNSILATDFINLKARIKAECNRRNLVGSVSKYASSSYDYTVIPTAGNAPLPEHYNKITTPFGAITGQSFIVAKSGNNVPSLNSISNELASLEKKGVRASDSGCASSCTGLCQGTCSGNCTGSCSGSCKSSCGNNCTGSCSSSCGTSCQQACSSCSSSCGTSCNKACSVGCSGGCSSGCSVLCQGTCKGLSEYNPVQ